MMTDQEINDFYLKLLIIIKKSQGDAYRYLDEQHSYGEMYSLMVKINSVLSKHRNAKVVLYTPKKFSAYAGIFSIFLSNNTWIPLSPEQPDARNIEILRQAEPSLVLYDDELPKSLSDYFSEKKIACFAMNEILSKNEKKDFQMGMFKKDDFAYIMFTSGSTGIPKGVPMTHENYINFVNNVLEILPFESNEVFSDFHDFAFDISIFSLFAFVLTESAISPIIEEKDKVIPINHIIENKVTVWSSVPSVINRIKTFRPKDNLETAIKIMFLCGEPLKFNVLKYCFENLNLKNVYNFYGLTETGVENFYHCCRPGDIENYADFGVAPIGKPIPGNKVIITTDKELCVGGCQVTPGYLGGISSEKFEKIDDIWWCKTGDIVEKYDDVYFCKGRLDAQVKLSGFRVELMDIEAHLIKLENIEDAVCFVNDNNGKELLVAALKALKKVDTKLMICELSKRLPKYMIPKDFIFLKEMPLNKNGKIDRKEVSFLYKNR